MNTVQDKVIVITGGGQGLGAAISRRLALDGAIVIPVDVKPEGLGQVVEEINNSGGRAFGYIMDVSDCKNVEETVQAIIGDHGNIDALINNAGIDYTKSIEELSHEEWNKVIGINLSGPFIVSKAIYPYLTENGRGHIVNIVSTAAKRAWANASVYHASKWGLLGFSHAL